MLGHLQRPINGKADIESLEETAKKELEALEALQEKLHRVLVIGIRHSPGWFSVCVCVCASVRLFEIMLSVASLSLSRSMCVYVYI